MVSSFQRESPIPDAIATWTLAFVRPTGPILSRCPRAINLCHRFFCRRLRILPDPIHS